MEGKGKKNQKVRVGDWICLLCGNHNYSFRQECNRCHNMKQIKEQNSYATPSFTFFQALFVENLMFDTKNYLLEDFKFQKKCQFCQQDNYFYQSKCENCLLKF